MPLIAVLFVFLSGSAFINRQAHKKQFEREHACWIAKNYYEPELKAPAHIARLCTLNRIARGELPIPAPVVAQ
jgi:hypothetical protein